jgi:predicted alpha/beta superfamily hydrolase
MIKYALFVVIFMSLGIIHAQEPIVSGEIIELKSSVLNEERSIQIQLPANYNNEDFAKGYYPVIYVLDGDFNFAYIAALERFNTKHLYRSQPEMIVVGIKNTDRTRDFTPTNDVVNRRGIPAFKTSGGADNFMKFIQEELQPFIDANYRTNGYNILLGHSFGGLFAMYVMLKNQKLFQSYIAIDPSLWWDDKFVYKMAKEKWATKNFKGISLFVGLAYENPKDSTPKFEHSNTIRLFCEKVLNAYPQNKLRGRWKYYPDYDHGNIPIAASLDGLKYLFNGMQLEVKQVPYRPELVKLTYTALSEKMHFNFIPEESLLKRLFNYTLSVGQKENAAILLNDALNWYPQSRQLKSLQSEL